MKITIIQFNHNSIEWKFVLCIIETDNTLPWSGTHPIIEYTLLWFLVYCILFLCFFLCFSLVWGILHISIFVRRRLYNESTDNVFQIQFIGDNWRNGLHARIAATIIIDIFFFSCIMKNSISAVMNCSI